MGQILHFGFIYSSFRFQWRLQDFGTRGEHFKGVGIVGGSAGRQSPPRTQENFRTLEIMHHFNMFFNFLKVHALNFCVFRQKPQRVRKLWEIFGKALKQLQKVYYFNIFCQDTLKKHALNFREFRRKTKLAGNFEKIWKFCKKVLRKLQKMYYFYHIFQNSLKPRVKLSRVYVNKQTKGSEIFRNFGNFPKNVLRKLQEFFYLSYFQETLKTSRWFFARSNKKNKLLGQF